MSSGPLHVGFCGAGIGGVAAAIAMARAGAKVTVLEAAPQLGEIGAGIQMTPNVARLLREWGVDKVIGDNLVQFEELNLRRKDGTKVGWTPMCRIEKALKQPWWLVHRHHLHQGLVEVARQHGCAIHINSRVASIDHQSSQQVKVTTKTGHTYNFDLLIGSDGVGSVVRKTLFPDVKPAPPTNNSAYRAIVPWEQVLADPVAKELVQQKTMEVWMSGIGYIITYPISAGKDFNMVMSHHTAEPTFQTTPVDVEEMRSHYKDFDPRIRRVLEMVPSVQRWPLLVTGPLNSWSNEQKNVVLMGDAAHSMVNHMAQGAATSMEDGAFLGRCIREVIRNRISLHDAVRIYERGRMPKAHKKQQVSFLNGALWHLPEGPAQEARDKAMEGEIRGEQLLRSPNLYGDPVTVWEVYAYDAEKHADQEIEKWVSGERKVMDEKTVVEPEEAEKIMNWMMPEAQKLGIRAKL
ncbi:salicylate hydroxylase [Saccharata proteae CBS 121410]|uniref:Salicylate hydroxylase n=1 Tax=Saccharata proteae CBS 121410 TaxID=1314787 RepID=A0A9P4I456_9PEZI|nr:salicylate hydroxylase [Saccharata proteae CBS 121410]